MKKLHRFSITNITYPYQGSRNKNVLVKHCYTSDDETGKVAITIAVTLIQKKNPDESYFFSKRHTGSSQIGNNSSEMFSVDLNDGFMLFLLSF